MGRGPGPDLPQRIPFLGEDLEVLLGQLDGGQGLQPEVGPALDELNQGLEGVQAQPVVAVVGQVGHEDADLEGGEEEKVLVSNAPMPF